MTQEKKPVNGITISIHWSDEGWMYDIWGKEIDELDREGEDMDSDDGGVCTTTLKNAIGMAVEQALDLIERDLPKCKYCDDPATVPNGTCAYHNYMIEGGKKK